MTCVAGIVEEDTMWIGADSARSTGDLLDTADTKIFTLGAYDQSVAKMIVGCAGRVRDTNVIRFGFQPPAHPEGMDDYQYMVIKFAEELRLFLKDKGVGIERDNRDSQLAQLLIGYKGWLYRVSSDYSAIRQEEGVAAIGTGTELALGSLYASKTLDPFLPPFKRIENALEAASHYISSVAPPFRIEGLTF